MYYRYGICVVYSDNDQYGERTCVCCVVLYVYYRYAYSLLSHVSCVVLSVVCCARVLSIVYVCYCVSWPDGHIVSILMIFRYIHVVWCISQLSIVIFRKTQTFENQ